MANKKRKKKSSYNEGGFDMKSLAALIVIIVGVALIIVLVKSAEGKNQESISGGQPQSSTNDSYDQNNSYAGDSTTVSSGTGEEETTTASTTSFKVSVNAEGTYNRTNIESANAAKLKVSHQDSEGFDFSLSLPDNNYAGYAMFVGPTTAEWTYDGSTMKLECAEGSITVTGFGSANGKYITGEPTYTDEPESDYDAAIVSSSATLSTLSGLMSSEDYSLFKLILSDGSYMGISQSSSEYQTDKNGVGVMVDKQTGMMKYQYELKYEGRCMILCSADGAVCIGIYNENDDTGELRYYASTSALRSDIPDCIRNYAVAYSLDLVTG